ncbi:MAG: DASS family sodium-coupled anion symporter [Actinomycetaceae bacterium]|nr:DASS family sodium-coupled anion symporter [Actinomycetaceae bacterium]
MTPKSQQVKRRSARPTVRKTDRRGSKPKAVVPNPTTKVKRFGQIAAVIGFLIPFVVDIPSLDDVGERMLAIFLAAIMLWVTEAIPLSATAVLVIMAEVLLVSDQALLPVAEGAPSSATFFASLANPVIILFLGGFMLADGAAKFGVDKAIAAVMLRPFLSSPKMMLMGVMLITATLSMFMSNTATTATMFAVFMPVLAQLPEGKSRVGLALSIPVAANVGGIGTPVGTPPNAIALGALQSAGVHISFVKWMALAVPLMLVVLAISWIWLAVAYMPKDLKIDLDLSAKFETGRNAMIFYVVAGVTVLLWMTEPLHGISSNTVGFVPVVLLMVTQAMSGDDLKALDWPVLWLVAGGIALGIGVGKTGLDAWIIGLINWTAVPVALLLLALAGVGFGMSNVISHSAAANLLIPLGMGLGASVAATPAEIAVVLALGCSLGMCLPISTPPNAIAYSTGEISTPRMVKTGLVVGVSGTVLLAFVMPLYWGASGLL